MLHARTEQADPKIIEQALAMHCGSLERTRHWTRRFIYTPGISDMADLCKAHWLLEIVATFCRSPALAAEEFQVWTLTVKADRSATLTVDDGNERILLTRTIHATDFPLDTVKLYLAEGTLMLPGEY